LIGPSVTGLFDILDGCDDLLDLLEILYIETPPRSSGVFLDLIDRLGASQRCRDAGLAEVLIDGQLRQTFAVTFGDRGEPLGCLYTFLELLPLKEGIAASIVLLRKDLVCGELPRQNSF